MRVIVNCPKSGPNLGVLRSVRNLQSLKGMCKLTAYTMLDSSHPFLKEETYTVFEKSWKISHQHCKCRNQWNMSKKYWFFNRKLRWLILYPLCRHTYNCFHIEMRKQKFYYRNVLEWEKKGTKSLAKRSELVEHRFVHAADYFLEMI